MQSKLLKNSMVAMLASVIALVPVTNTLAGPVGPGGRIGDDKAAGAPIVGLDNPNVIPGRYIVVFSPRGTENGTNEAAQAVKAAAMNEAVSLGAEVHFDYSSAVNGFAATLPEKALKALQQNPNVAFIEADQMMFAIGDGTPEAPDVTQSPATWGLDRIDQRNLPLSNSYTYNTTASNVNAYIIDTGIRKSHAEFGGRAFTGYDAVTAGGSAEDCNGHGTHVAGTVGGSTYGVAKGVRLYAVRVLDCNGSGTNSGVIAGIDWVRTNRVLPAVANMSLGGGASSALDTAVTNAINAGVVMAVAAGNENQNACNVSPSRTAAAITVGSTTNTDARSSFSNWGTCLDIFAPGSNITSAWYTSDSATNTISGTSMATPHVAGCAALYLATNTSATPAQVRDALYNNATNGLVTSPGTGSVNKLLYCIFGGGTPTPTPTPTNTQPPSGNNVVVNPGFESGTAPWVQYSSGGYTIVDGTRPRSGVNSAYYCNYNSCNEYLEQAITVPANGTLTYYWYQTSSEGTTTAYDYLRVQVYSNSGTLLATLRTWSNRNTRNVWSLDTISMAAYAGQTVKLRFSSTTDSSILSAFWVDDVSVK